jgi:hypothetical protein
MILGINDTPFGLASRRLAEIQAIPIQDRDNGWIMDMHESLYEWGIYLSEIIKEDAK